MFDINEKVAIAKELEPEALEKNEQKFIEFLRAHKEDTDSYHFECRRWGDFLALYFKRKSTTQFATAINLKETRAITPTSGNIPDYNGKINYYYDSFYNDKTNKWDNKVQITYPEVNIWKPVFDLDTNVMSRNYVGNKIIIYQTPNYARPAKDDEIYFDGIGGRIYTPAGKGIEVYNILMMEILRGSPTLISKFF